MSNRWSIHRYGNKGSYPYVLSVQAAFLRDLATCIVVPLGPLNTTVDLGRLSPVVSVEGSDYRALFPQLSAIRRSELGTRVAYGEPWADQFRAALDFLLYGV